jgi:hypothetical protein
MIQTVLLAAALTLVGDGPSPIEQLLRALSRYEKCQDELNKSDLAKTLGEMSPELRDGLIGCEPPEGVYGVPYEAIPKTLPPTRQQ